MKIKIFAVLFVLSLSLAAYGNGSSMDELTTQATAADTGSAIEAIGKLRAMGQPGLDALFAKYRAEIVRYEKTGDADDNWKRVANALDTVSMQHDDYSSQLYWYTDLEAAKRAAVLQNKPILSLRLLGNLNEEFSCANSRLFRAVLYSNAAVAKYLRENYILHWKSVRPAPRITIDFGDGRKIERTITGNSIHYILDKNGNILDALPGLYTPEMFLSYLKNDFALFRSLEATPATQRNAALMKYRKNKFTELKDERTKAITTAGVQMTEPKTGTLAILAAPMAMSKAIVVDEYSILRVYDDFAKFESTINFDDWTKLAKAYVPTPKIDEKSNAFIRRQNVKTGLTEGEFAGLFAKLDNFIAIDTTRNDFLFHMKLYEWLNGRRGGDLEALNAQVYDQIFKTPNTDKWLGLYSSDVYTALDGNGIIR